MLWAGFVFAFSLAFLFLLFGALFVSVRMSMGVYDFIRFFASAILAHINLNPPVI
jgi:hypothetical protein